MSSSLAASSSLSSSLVIEFPRTKGWVTPKTYAALMSRSVRLVQLWCLDGTLKAFHIPTYRDTKGKWWIFVA